PGDDDPATDPGTIAADRQQRPSANPQRRDEQEIRMGDGGQRSQIAEDARAAKCAMNTQVAGFEDDEYPREAQSRPEQRVCSRARGIVRRIRGRHVSARYHLCEIVRSVWL